MRLFVMRAGRSRVAIFAFIFFPPCATAAKDLAGCGNTRFIHKTSLKSHSMALMSQ